MGYLEQEPQLDDALTVRENVESWCEEKKLVDRFNEVVDGGRARTTPTS